MSTALQQPATDDRLKYHQRYLARAVGGSALRNQGAKGMVEAARAYLETIDLRALSESSREQYMADLDRMTNELAARFPDGGTGNWGAARKSINIFVFACSRELAFSRAYRLDRLCPFLELPLDKYAIQYLRRNAQSDAERAIVEGWQSIKSLTKPLSDQIQQVASIIATRADYHRCELDLVAWTDRSEA